MPLPNLAVLKDETVAKTVEDIMSMYFIKKDDMKLFTAANHRQLDVLNLVYDECPRFIEIVNIAKETYHTCDGFLIGCMFTYLLLRSASQAEFEDIMKEKI